MLRCSALHSTIIASVLISSQLTGCAGTAEQRQAVATATASATKNRFEQERLRIEFPRFGDLKLERKVQPTYDELTADLPQARGSFNLWTYSTRQHNVRELMDSAIRQESIKDATEQAVVMNGAAGRFVKTVLTVDGKPMHAIRAVVQRDDLPWLYMVAIDATTEQEAAVLWSGFLTAKLL